MDHNRKHSRHKKGLISGLKHKARKLFKNISSAFKSEPAEYRPYLGPQNENQPVEFDGKGLSNDDDKHTNHLKSPQKPIAKKSKTKRIGLKELSKRWELNRAERKKNKYKRKIKSKLKKEHRKRARIDFIRKFIPQYKKPVKPLFLELSDEETAELKKQQQKNYYQYTVNSVALYVIAYLVMYMIYQITVLIVASKWKLDSVLFYYNLAFNDYSPLWSRTNIIFVTLSGPLVCLLIGILFYKVIANRKNIKSYAKLFVMWIAMHGFNFFLGAWSSGVSFYKGFGYVPAWLYMNIVWQIFVSLLFLFILGIIGYYSVPKFLDTSNSAYRVRQENKVKFLFHQVVLPWLIGSLIIFLVKIPFNMPYDSGNLITMMFGIVPVLFNRYAKPTITFEKERKRTNIRWIFVVTFVAIILLYRVGLNNGIHVILNYNFIFSLHIKPL